MGQERLTSQFLSLQAMELKEFPSIRATILATVFVIIFAFVIPINDLYLRNTPLAGNLLPTNTVLVLLVFVLIVNPILRVFLPKFAFRSAELAALWALMVIPSGIAMAGFWRYILPQIANLLYSASPVNRWDTLLLPYAPDWLVVLDKVTVRGFYEGNAGKIVWDGWFKPFGFWIPFGCVLLFATICLASLIRRQWTEHEHFTFPLVQLPHELVRTPAPNSTFPPLFSARPFWLGFLFSAGFHTLCGLNTYFPSVPAFRRIRRLGEYLTGFPWDSISGTFLNIYPAGVGLTYLLANEIAFSLWFFFIAERLQQVLFARYGWTTLGMSATDFVQFQQVGAIVGLLVVIFWAGKDYWRKVLAKAVGRLKEHDDKDEPLPYPLAFWGLSFSVVFLVAWLVARNVSWVLAVTFVLMALGFYLAAAWIASNGGMLMVQMRILPHDSVWALVGSQRFSRRDIIVSFLLQKAFTYDLRETLMPSLLNAMKMADLTNLSKRCLMLLGMAMIALAIPVALFSWMRICYTHGGANLEGSTFLQWHAIHPYLLMVQAIDPGIQPNLVRSLGLVVGFAVFVGCFALRRQLVWFPLHPMGLIVCRGWAMENLWLMILLGWAIKGLVVRYGGMNSYQGLKPLFLGLILGDLTMGGIFGFAGAFTRKGYSVLP
ncbi:MAG: DUF6785 family protein [Armatimonadota bacterium]|nr:hypothetical protein [Armatimonadota bacterium]MDW8142971.1 DUF6785 family protein [Armatimonadota bacterium]